VLHVASDPAIIDVDPFNLLTQTVLDKHDLYTSLSFFLSLSLSLSLSSLFVFPRQYIMESSPNCSSRETFFHVSILVVRWPHAASRRTASASSHSACKHPHRHGDDRGSNTANRQPAAAATSTAGARSRRWRCIRAAILILFCFLVVIGCFQDWYNITFIVLIIGCSDSGPS